MKKTRVPVFVFEINPAEQIGNGIYSTVACFTNLGIHVPFISDGRRVPSVGEPTPCDNSCEYHLGHMEDFSKERHHCSFEIQRIVTDAVQSFHLPDEINE